MCTKHFTAAVVRQIGTPRDDEVRVRVVATSMCHTDIVARDQVHPATMVMKRYQAP